MWKPFATLLLTFSMLSGCVTSYGTTSLSEGRLEELLNPNEKNLTVKNKTVLFGSEEETSLDSVMKIPEPTFTERVASLTLPETEKQELLQVFAHASDQQKEQAISVLEAKFASKSKSEKKESDQTKPASEEKILDNFIQRLEKLPQVKQSQAEMKRLPEATHSDEIKLVSQQQIASYPRTEDQTRDSHATHHASRIPVSAPESNTEMMTKNIKSTRNIDAVALASAAETLPEEFTSSDNSRHLPRLSLQETAREATARRTDHLADRQTSPKQTGSTENLNANQLLVMEIIWDHGELSFQNLFHEVNLEAKMAQTKDTQDKGRSSQTAVVPPVLSHDELQAVLYQLEDAAWIDHQVRGNHIYYWSKKQKPKNTGPSWEKLLQDTIGQLESTTRGNRLSQQEKAQLQVYLRLLYLTAQRKADAVEKPDAVDEAQQQFWSNLLFGLADYLHQTDMPEDQRNLLALRSIRRAVNHLADSSPLDVHNLHFIESVESFGRFTPFKTTTFKANQEVLLYAEIDNLSAQQVGESYQTTLESTYEIFDRAGRRVDYRKFPEVKDECKNLRRDFYVPYRLYIPENLSPGEYILELGVKDVASGKFGKASIDFSVQP